jgi:hypothetical protein
MNREPKTGTEARVSRRHGIGAASRSAQLEGRARRVGFMARRQSRGRVVTACPSRLLWDAAFDAGKISSADDGKVLFHPSLGVTERGLILTNAAPRLAGLSPEHLVNIERHRRRAGF